jgi:hypothetical protein
MLILKFKCLNVSVANTKKSPEYQLLKQVL